MKINIKKLSTIELAKINKAVPNFEPYNATPTSTIYSISEIGRIIRMYRDMAHGHKTRAGEIYAKLIMSTKIKLPAWVSDYFIKDDDCMSYDEWRAFGRQVKQGQTFVSRSNSGKPLFSKTQTIVRFSENPPKGATGKEVQSTFSKV